MPKLVVAGTGELRLKQKRGEASSVKSSHDLRTTIPDLFTACLRYADNKLKLEWNS